MITSMKFVFTLIILAVCTSAHAKPAENHKPLPLEVYSALPHKSMLTVSPNGKMLAYRMTDDKQDLFVIVDTVKQKLIGGLNIAEIQPEQVYFINNEQLLFVVSKHRRLYGYQGKYNVNTALIYTIANEKLSPLLRPGDGIATGQTDLGNVIGISTDGNWAYMPALTGKTGAVLRYDLMAVNLQNPGRKPRTHIRGTEDTIDYFIKPNTDQVLARERFNNDDDLHTIEVRKDDKWQVVFQESTEYTKKSFTGVTADGKSLVMLKNSTTQGSAYYLLSLNTGKLSKPLFLKEGSEIAATLSDINRVVAGVRYAGFKPSYAFFDENTQKKLQLIQQELPNSSIYISDYTSDWKKVIFHVEGDGLVGDYLYLEDGQLGHVGSIRPDISWQAVNNVVEFSFKARDGLVIPTLLTIPNSAVNSTEKLPAIILPHGGPESYDTSDFDWLSQYFASRGYLVIQPQFRGSKGFGAEFTLKGRGEWGKKMQDDLTDAVNQLITMGEIDANKVCIVGSSYGGYAALAGAAFTPEVYQCAIAINGVSDIDFMMKNDRDTYGKEHSVIAYWDDVLRTKTLPDDYFETISPINFVDNIKVPVLLIASELDKVVSPKQSSRMYSALEDEDKNVTYVELENEGHNLLKAQSRLKILQAIEQFIGQHNPAN
ncbi:prolyl oligopeptidase family serine peptidase [Colwellia sp. D2M02]|uniref:alpha/beta fold hydrolase n=1 Tax=Colwellia sp. D2M02 TaxID=2841562 RepID=UPI001C085365|nr:alpha/beta fold hydrolase [Colwellia sp. D2M02]MBU2891735.1 prolyl oligopeptidase family serine peptidase [Colwellia sp. D2M02]